MSLDGLTILFALIGGICLGWYARGLKPARSTDAERRGNWDDDNAEKAQEFAEDIIDAMKRRGTE